MRISLGSDHGGYEIRMAVAKSLEKRGVDVDDLGCHDKESVDYPDFASLVSEKVSHGKSDQGILVCTTGIGMSMAANKFPRVRAALCTDIDMVKASRNHNNANILVLGASLMTEEDVDPFLDAWLDVLPDEAERHHRRVDKIDSCALQANDVAAIYEEDQEVFAAISEEVERQNTTINLIASENYVSRAVGEAQGSVMTNKYAEGYPSKRWYHGCSYVDDAEQLAIDRAKEIFGAEHVNVQPHCGSSANMIVYFAMLNPGDTILAMNLAHGGHLTHGNKVNFSGRLFDFVSYGVSEDTELIDYEEIEAKAKEHKPKMIVAGASAYPRLIDFKRFREIADSVGAYLMVDMAHIAGLVAAGCHPSPVPYSEFVTTTTHKTMRGPRGGMILCQERFAAEIDKTVFPGMQGGPLMHEIAAKAVCFHEALRPEFKEYGKQIVKNAAVMADVFLKEGFRLVSGGTENHLMLIDLSKEGLTGKDAAEALDQAGLIVNKNAIPFDKESPFVTSGVRIGTPTVTSHGMKEPEMQVIAEMIVNVLRNIDDKDVSFRTRDEVKALISRFKVI